MSREPAVAGQFYAGSKEALDREIRNCFISKLGFGKIPVLSEGKRKIKGAVVPHAGYMYSGPVATHTYGALAEDGFPEVFIIFGPNHTGYGSGVAITTETFSTPFGDVEVDKEIAKNITKGIICDDSFAHMYEHSIEVQLPFLQFISKKIKFVPICMAMQDYDTAIEVGKIVREGIEGKNVVVLASTDFSHYEKKELAEKKDRLAIDAILALDPKKLFKVVKENRISMCGYGPVMAMLEAVQGNNAKLLRYATSGDVSPMRDVVGYGSIIVE
ncbi:MAG: MEMO1 family protein [Candidatus Thermoplasmatota archaeon]